MNSLFNRRDNHKYLSPSEITTRANTPSSNGSPSRKGGLTPKQQQLELVGFAQNIHQLNQEVHKNLRHNKAGVPITNIDKLPHDYKRPPGFVLIPGLLGNIPGGDHHILNLIKANGKSNQLFEKLEEQSR